MMTVTMQTLRWLQALVALWVMGLAPSMMVMAANPADVVPPATLELVEAVLPDDTPKANVDVVIWLTIDTDGTVSEVELKTPGGEPHDSAALAAASKFRFSPATVAGEPVKVRVPFTYQFRKPLRRGRIVNAGQARRGIEPAPGFIYAGRVVEKGTRAPQGGLPVTVINPRTKQRWEVISEEDGSFVLYGLAPGKLTLDIFTGEFKQLTRKISVEASDAKVALEDPATFYLSPAGPSQYRTVVKEKKPPAAATVIDLTEDELTRVAGTFGDPTRVVASLPGVARSPFGLGYYVVRGAQFDNTGFFIDGHPSIFLYHLLGGPGIIHPELVGGLSFYPGGYPAKYGRFAAGVIAIDTKDAPRDRWHLDIELDLFKAGILFSVPFDDKKGIVTLSFRRSYFELLLPLFSEDITLNYTDYQARISYDFSPTVRGRLIFLGADDNLAQSNGETDSGDGSQDAALNLGFHRVNLALDVDLSKHVTFSNSAIWEYDYIGNRFVAEGDTPITADLSGFVTQLRSIITYAPRKTLTIESGLDLLYSDIGADLNIPIAPVLGDPRPPDFDPIIVNAKIDDPITSIAPFLSASWEPIEGLRLLPGLRLNLDEYGGDYQVTADPKIAVRWQLHEQWTIKAMAALSHQVPQLFQVAEPFGDPSLPPVEGTQTSLGFEWAPNSDWFISVEGFVQLLDNLAQTDNSVVADGDDVGRVYFNTNLRGRAFGAEVLIRKAFGGRIYGWIAYTLSRAERDRADGRGWQIYNLDQTHNLSVATTVRLGNEWSLGARFQLTSGNRYFPIEGAKYDSDRNRWLPLYSLKEDRLPFYHRLDIRLDKRWRYDDWMLEAFLDIQNVYNASNPEQQRYSYDFGIQSEGVSFPFLPTLGVRAVF
ncbi:MAG: TonB family protein [Myxococcota bacterium]|jgi:TonB family protein